MCELLFTLTVIKMMHENGDEKTLQDGTTKIITQDDTIKINHKEILKGCKRAFLRLTSMNKMFSNHSYAHSPCDSDGQRSGNSSQCYGGARPKKDEGGCGGGMSPSVCFILNC